eukprot:259685_1
MSKVMTANSSGPSQCLQDPVAPNYGSIQSNNKRIFHLSPNHGDIYSTNTTIVHKSVSTTGASSLSTSFNIIKAIVGSGILCLPWATANTGLLATFILLVISGILSYICWMFIIQCSHELKVYQFRDLALRLLGTKVALLVDFNFIVLAIIYSILYSVYIGEFVANGLTEFGVYIDQSNGFNPSIHSKCFIITIIILVICGPLTLLPKLDYLQYSSLIGITGTMITIIYIDYTFFMDDTVHNNVTWINTHNHSTMSVFFWLESFGVFSATFFGHFNTASLYGELNQKSVPKMRWITVITFAFIAILNLLMLIPGYLSFGNDVHQNVIESLVITNQTKGIVATLRILMALNMIGSYPLLFWNLKISMKNLVFYDSNGVPRTYTTENVERLVYFGINVMIWLIALYSRDVAELLSLVQAVSGNAILFVFPPWFYYELMAKKGALDRTVCFGCFGIAVFGLIAMVGGIISTAMNMSGVIQSVH